MANTLQPKYQFGKNDLTDNFIKQIDSALEANELIKISVLETSPLSPRELCPALSLELFYARQHITGDITHYLAEETEAQRD